MSPNLTGKVCLVTGATKGIGRGIAVQLGQAGAKVYVTGRTKEKLDGCAAEITRRGGKGVGVCVDHGEDDQVKELFERIDRENNGRLDVLVNNAYAAVDHIVRCQGKKFHEMDPVKDWDTINGVGLRGHYICATYAARIMAKRKSGLIVNISSFGGLQYLFNVCYGVGKCAMDRMAADCAMELKSDGVSMVSLWPGVVQTEYMKTNIMDGGRRDNLDPLDVKRLEKADPESVEFSGMAVAHLAADDPRKVLATKSGRVLFTPDLAYEYGFRDLDGGVHGFRTLKQALNMSGWFSLAEWVPNFIRMPLWMVYFAGYKF